MEKIRKTSKKCHCGRVVENVDEKAVEVECWVCVQDKLKGVANVK